MVTSSLRAVLGATLALAGCAGDPSQPGGPSADDRLGVWVPPPGFTILRTTQSRLENPTMAMVERREAWAEIWTRAWGGVQLAPPLPEVDFVLASVVVVGLGRLMGAGHAVGLDSVVVHLTGAVVYATETLPGGGCSPAETSMPVHMVLMPGHPPIQEWRMATQRRDCP